MSLTCLNFVAMMAVPISVLVPRWRLSLLTIIQIDTQFTNWLVLQAFALHGSCRVLPVLKKMPHSLAWLARCIRCTYRTVVQIYGGRAVTVGDWRIWYRKIYFCSDVHISKFRHARAFSQVNSTIWYNISSQIYVSQDPLDCNIRLHWGLLFQCFCGNSLQPSSLLKASCDTHVIPVWES